MDKTIIHTYENIRKLVLHIFNRKFLIFLFFLVLSGIFWLMMTLNETYEQEIVVPVRLVNVPENVVITTDIDSTVRVTVRDKGYTLTNYLYGEGVKTVNINFNSYAGKNAEYGNVSITELQKMIYKNLVNSSRIVSIAADKMDFYFNYGQSKSVPVVMNGSIKTGRAYYLAHTRFSPQRVTVYASKKMLDSINSVKIEPLHISNLTDTLIRDVKLSKIKGVKCVPNTVRIGLYPDVLTEESIEVTIRPINVPEGIVMRTFPTKAKVKFIVGVGMYRNINENLFDVVVNYNEVAKQSKDKCTVYLRKSPVGIRTPRLETNQVDYLIEHQ